MPLEHYDIETDGLYLEGKEKGYKIGIELAMGEKYADMVRNFTVRMLQLSGLSKEKIAFVNEIERMLLDTSKGLQ